MRCSFSPFHATDPSIVEALGERPDVDSYQGASRLHLVTLLANEYLVLVGVGMLVAFPVAFAIIADWLNQFSERINQSVGLYFAAAVLLTVITWLTVSGLGFRAASMRPAESLRQD